MLPRLNVVLGSRLEQLRPPRRRPGIRTWHVVAGLSAAVAGAAATAAIVWRFFVGDSDSGTPGKLAAATAASVAEAARQLVVDAADDGDHDPVAAVRGAAIEAVLEAATAGADITAAAFGVLDAANAIERTVDGRDLLIAAVDGIREAALTVGEGALQRVEAIIHVQMPAGPVAESPSESASD